MASWKDKARSALKSVGYSTSKTTSNTKEKKEKNTTKDSAQSWKDKARSALKSAYYTAPKTGSGSTANKTTNSESKVKTSIGDIIKTNLKNGMSTNLSSLYDLYTNSKTNEETKKQTKKYVDKIAETSEKIKSTYSNAARFLSEPHGMSDDEINDYKEKVNKEIDDIVKKSNIPAYQTANKYKFGNDDVVNIADNATLYDITIGSIKKGWVTTRYNMESWKEAEGKPNNKKFYEEKLKEEDYSFVPDSAVEKVVSNALELVGQIAYQTVQPETLKTGMLYAGGFAAGAAALGQSGPQFAAPEEVVTVPTAFFAGLGKGIAVGNAKASFEVEAGAAYNEMIENGISKDTAKKIAMFVGGSNAALEFLQVDTILDAGKILAKNPVTKEFGNKLLSKAATQTAAKATSKSSKAAASKMLKQLAAETASETAQEVAQEAVTTTGANVASKLDKGNWEYSWDEIGQRLGETAVSSALSFGLLGSVKGAGGYAVNRATNRTSNDIATSNTAATQRTIRNNTQIADDLQRETTAEPVETATPAGLVADVINPVQVTDAVVTNNNISGQETNGLQVHRSTVSSENINIEDSNSNAVTYASPQASDTVKRVETVLINSGVSEQNRKNIVESTERIDNTLSDSNVSTNDVIRDVTTITDDITNEITNTTKNTADYWNVFSANLRPISSEKDLIDTDFVNAYTSAFADSLSEDSVTYREISKNGNDVAATLSDYILYGNEPEGVNTNILDRAASSIKKIVVPAVENITSLHNTIYGENSIDPAKIESIKNGDFTVIGRDSSENDTASIGNISLTKVGDFYEAYGDDAVELANKLDLIITPRIINGERVDMVGFPASVLESYNKKFNSLTSRKTENTHDMAIAEKVKNDTNDTLQIDEKGVIRFNQLSIDYKNDKLRSGSYKIIVGDKFNKTETVKGVIVGKYGVNERENSKYACTLLSSGMGTFSFDTKREAQQFAAYVNENIPFNDVQFIEQNGSYKLDITDGFKAYADDLKRIYNSKEYIQKAISAEITDGKVPFTNKSGCIEYLKSHIGDTVTVTYGNGVSEQRTVDSVSSKSLKTKKPDGTVSTLELKGLNFKKTGFSVDYGNGNTIDYDFVNADKNFVPTTETVENTNKTAERVINSQKAKENTPISDEKTEYKHLYNENTVSKDFINSVNPEIESAILNIRKGNIEAVPDVIEVTELTEETVKAISDFIGFDVSGFTCKIEKDALQHIENRHGVNGEHDQSMSDPKDIARMGYVINNNDHIEWVIDGNGNIKLSRKYNTKDNKSCPIMLISARIDGTYCVSQVIPDTKRKTIWVSSARIEKADGGNQVPNGNNVTPQRTPETPLSSSSANNNISQKTKTVNSVGNTADKDLTASSDNSEGSNNTSLSDKIRISEPEEIYNDVFYGTDGSEIILTDDEKNAILKYKNSYSYIINDILREDLTISDEDAKLRDDMNSALGKFPTYKGLVYRNIGFILKKDFDAVIDRYINSYSKEDGITEKAFTSASKSSDGYTVDEPYKVHFIINSETGKDVSNVGIKDEAEVLFHSGTKFDITSSEINENEIYITGTERVENGETTVDNRSNRKKTEGDTGEQEFIERKGEATVQTGIREGGTADSGVPGESSESDNRRIRQGREGNSSSGSERDRNVSISEGEVQPGDLTDKTKNAAMESAERKNLIDEYTHDMSPMQKGKVSKTLNAVYKTDEYGPLTYAEFMERSIADGRLIEERRNLKAKIRSGKDNYDLSDEFQKKKAAYHAKGMNSFDFVKETRDIKNGKSSGNTIKSVDPVLYYYLTGDESVLPGSSYDTTYRVMTGDNTFYSVPKTVYDYGMWLQNRSANAQDSAETVKESVSVSTEEKQQSNTPTSYDVAFFEKIGSDIRKGKSVSLKDMRNAVDAILLNRGEAIKAELSQLKNDELKKRISIYDRGRITKKAEMVDSIYTDMLSNLYYAISGKSTMTYLYDGTSFEEQQSKMLFDISRELTEESFSKRLADNAETYKKQLAAREEKIAKIKNPQTFEDYAYKKRNFGLSDEEAIQYENLYAEERRKVREGKKTAKTVKDTGSADAFFANSDNYTIEKTTHTKTGEDIWVVKPKDRLETSEWQKLNTQMRALGGNYWRGNGGWNFKHNPIKQEIDQENSQFNATSVSKADKLRGIANNLQKQIDEKFKDRLTNTAKRAREAASAEAEGERLQNLQATINNIAEAIESGKNTLLDKIDSKAQVETLMFMLHIGRRNRISETLPNISYDERLQEQDKPFSNDDVKYAEYPLTKIHESAVTEYIRAAEGKAGYKQITDRLKKSLKGANKGYVTVDAQLFSDIDKIVQNLSTYRADFWNDGVAERKRLARMGIENVVELRAYLREFIGYLPGRNAEAERQRAIKAQERNLANSKIEGFFPTPKAIVEKMLDEADIKPGETLLEPSAGKGNIADEIKAKHPDNALDVVEWNSSLNQLLSEKGHNVVGNDFLKLSGNYDKIVMNPPFEKGQDIDHVRHAYDLLNDGGRVVAIMSEGPFYRSDNKATEFRAWLDEVGGTSEKLPEGSFKNSERSTGVNTRLVVIDKNEGPGSLPKIRSSRDIETTDKNKVLPYSYDALTSKDDMVITTLEDENIYTSEGQLDRKSIIDKGIKNARSKNNPKNTENNTFVYVPDIGIDVMVTKDGLRHGLTRKSEATARATMKIGDILENSIKVNELSPRKSETGAYILFGIAADETGYYYPVRAVVSNYTVNEIEALDVLYAVNAKRRTSPQMRQGVVENSTPLIKGSSTISISELLNIVKNGFSDVLSDDVLRKLGVERRNSSLSDSIKYSHDDGNLVDTGGRWTTEHIESKKNSDVNIAQIVKDIRKKFGIPISTGKVTDRSASGIYKEQAESIRTRIANNLPTISHELGHHLDKKYNLKGMSSVKILRKAVSQDFLERYPSKERNGEAVAEFVRIYLRNYKAAERLSPSFYNEFLKTLSDQDLKAVNQIALSVNRYLSYDISKRYDTAIVRSKEKEKVPFKQRWDKLYQEWIDLYHPIKDAVDYVQKVDSSTLSGNGNAYVLATNSLNAHTVANYLITEGFRDLNGNLVDAKSFTESIGMVDSKHIKQLDKYLVLRHSLEWIAPKDKDVAPKRVFADETLEDIDQIKKQITAIEKKHPEIKAAAENLYEFQSNVLKYFVAPAGGMTNGMIESLKKKYPNYVPFHRVVGNKHRSVKGTFVNQRIPIRRAKGSGELIISPCESIIQNTENMVKFALRNQTAQILADYADNVDGFAQFMESVPPDMIPHVTDVAKQKKEFEDALHSIVKSSDDYFAISDALDTIFGDAVTGFSPIANANKKIITVLRNGKPTYYQIHDEDLYKAVAELSPKQLDGFARISAKFMQPMKILTTQLNPLFAASNVIRDIGTAYKLSPTMNPIKFAIEYTAAMKSILTNSVDYKQYKAMGGGHSSDLTANIEDISRTLKKVARKDMGRARRLVYAIFRNPVETVANINDFVESIPRFSEFRRTLKEGGDLRKAIYNANEITTNFKRIGASRGAKEANAIFMYNNAAIQGLDKVYRTFKDPKTRYKTMLKWVLSALVMSAIENFWNKENDDEGWKNLSSYKKNNFYNFALGDGMFISIPKPRENGLLDAFTERTVEYALGNKDAFYDFGGYMAMNLIPPMVEFAPDILSGDVIGSAHTLLGNTVIGGLSDVGFNEDFKGTPIESAYDRYLPSNERYSENTTKAAYALGQTKAARKVGLSPKQIDSIISSYTGMLGQINKALLPVSKSRQDKTLGLRNKFVSDSYYSTDLLNKMYDNKDKAELEFNYNPNIQTAVEYEQNAIITSYISGMNNAVKAMPEESQRAGRAFLLKSLNSLNFDNTESQSMMLERLDGETITDDYILTDLPSSKLKWTKDKVKYTYQMTPQEYDQYVKDYLSLVEKYRIYQGENISDITDYTNALDNTNAAVLKVLSPVYKERFQSKAQAEDMD